jgi:hypothetical protein
MKRRGFRIRPHQLSARPAQDHATPHANSLADATATVQHPATPDSSIALRRGHKLGDILTVFTPHATLPL